jgi:hypothetical protein
MAPPVEPGSPSETLVLAKLERFPMPIKRKSLASAVDEGGRSTKVNCTVVLNALALIASA